MKAVDLEAFQNDGWRKIFFSPVRHSFSVSARGRTFCFRGSVQVLRENLGRCFLGGLLFEPKDWYQHYTLGVGYEGTGKLPEAISEYQKAIQMSGDSRSVVALAHAYAAVGKKTEAAKILRDLERKLKATSASPYTMATIYAARGESDKALEFLEEVYSEKSFDISWLKSDPLLDILHPDPRFQNLLQRIGLSG